ncbi:DegT/DnrJ/EryC1/StrS family aminotransferase [Pseudomonas sp. O64]|uniref:DegT/DnrJ/EryC1/StrS family aminotransferase n=1 Tax=Pseudomonas TaxID=286 RepID=UPI000BA07D22|nr:MULTISPECIES: DegT/DnrJ/EryC1/StrS aminotransferase family protein [unclassified Pseudomonas]MCV2226413.1 DegT/DnrJ/EryC1/StrS aminotransferase family protein [Pseudomonas sp. AU10]OZO05567.1 perosamine synthetase [Pseudomonas sp. IB20]
MIPVYQPFLGGREKEYVNQCLDSTWISSRGEFIPRFENEFARYIGAAHATTVSNGTVALHLAMAALGLGPGDEVIVPTLTYVASVNTIMQTGAKVVYAESRADTWNISVQDVRCRITPNTKAIMIVHLYGLACDMDELVALCREHNLLLIEDCAEAFGSLYKGRHIGTFGDVATFSFFGNKTITTGEGGMVVCKSRYLHERACHLKSQGVSKTREYWHDELAFNYRMTNICAAIGLAQLERADEILALKRQVARWYHQALEGLPLRMHAEQSGTRHSYWMCSVLLDDPSRRQALRDQLKSQGIETRPLFAPAHTMPHCKTNEDFPIAQDLSARGMNLPSYPTLSREQVVHVADAIRRFFAD